MDTIKKVPDYIKATIKKVPNYNNVDTIKKVPDYIIQHVAMWTLFKRFLIIIICGHY